MVATSDILIALLFACPCVAMFVGLFFKGQKNIDIAKVVVFFIGVGFILSALLLIRSLDSSYAVTFFSLHLTTLNTLLCTLIFFVSFIVHRFSIRYMAGDNRYYQYFFLLPAITLSAAFWVLVDNIFLLWLGWTLSQVILILLMVHKSKWEAAKNSGWLTFKILMSGSLCLVMAMILLYATNETASIEAITKSSSHDSFMQKLALSLILFAALAQSALWPFHRWMLSSLNSPTPVSALMHAGLVNGGGILIVKFAPLFFISQTLLTILFIVGAITTFLGSIWKLLQNDIKRMLACSTMAQMGFMMMQCALGLFAAAITHLCWHGLFKAYLFLNSGSAITQTKPENNFKMDIGSRLLSIAGGTLAMYAFAFITNKPVFSLNTTTFLLVFAFISGAQLTLAIQTHWRGVKRSIIALAAAFLSGVLYGESIYLIEALLPNFNVLQLPKLNILHELTLALFLLVWFAFNFGLVNKYRDSRIWCRFYMMMLNKSQPHPKTVTAIRNTYQF